MRSLLCLFGWHRWATLHFRGDEGHLYRLCLRCGRRDAVDKWKEQGQVKVGAFSVVWQEARYLGLVIEQLLLCPGPKLLLWMDQPLFWYSYDHPPSGYASRVRDVVAKLDPHHEIQHVLRQPTGARGYLEINEIAFDILRKFDCEIVVRFDSDWIFTIDEMQRLYAHLLDEEPSDVIRWNVEARHYWRNWQTVYADTGIGVAFRIEDPDIWKHYEPHQYKKLPFTCYHPSYVLTNGECFLKVKSWMHAPEFEERGFYDKEWLPKDDSKVKPWPADIPLPSDVRERLSKHKAWLPGQEP